ncbi:hypothetical protein, partial [Fusicatenibacter saccharivorans]|uniref:hypothetical protein n=1 Tax=Fusicatenibacter saccharivorans TaxID=1150298 RepID=UPI0034A24548
YSELLQLVKGWSNLVSNRIIIWRLRSLGQVQQIKMVKTCSYPEHYFCRENTIFIGKVTDTAVFVGNVADGFDSYAVS